MPQTFEGSDADADNLKLLKHRAAEYVGIWKNVIEWIPDGTSLSFNQLVYWKTIEFDNKRGRATLAGDAAHPMTPQRGRGLNHAIYDVANLVIALNKVQKGELHLNDALNDYGDEIVKRGGDAVEESLLNTQMVHDWNSLRRSPLMVRSLVRDKA
jgi:2-polyprenyl-6-methoxyphenol hydroxylase-like FAD-dependent oxidoreductase